MAALTKYEITRFAPFLVMDFLPEASLNGTRTDERFDACVLDVPKKAGRKRR